jgi:hypothetical protein
MTDDHVPNETAETQDPNVTKETHDLYLKLRSTQRTQTWIRSGLGVFALLVILIYGWLGFSTVNEFDEEYFLEGLNTRMEKVRPVALGAARQVFDENQVEFLARIEAAMVKNAPAMQKSAEQQMDQMMQEMSVLLAAKYRAFVDSQLKKHRARILALYPEVKSPEDQMKIVAQINEVVMNAVNMALDEELKGMERAVAGLEETFFMPEVRAKVEEIRKDPDHQTELSNRLVNIIYRPFIEP